MGRKAKDDDETRPIFKKEVPEDLTVEESNALYDEAHGKRASADRLEEELAQHTAKRKAEIKELRGEADRLDAQAHDKKRMVWRDVREQLRGSQVFVVRVDNGEIVDQRAATPAELQQDFPGLDHGKGLPTPSAAGGSSDDDDKRPGDGDPNPVIHTPPGAVRDRGDDEELEPDHSPPANGPRSAAERRTRAPKAAAGKGGKGGKGSSKGRGK